MVFIVAQLKRVSFQLHADNLWGNSYDVDTLLAVAQYTVPFVKVVGQKASPSKCVLLGTSKAARKRMTAWRNEHPGCFWAVELGVRDSGGHPYVTQRALAGTLSSRLKEATSHFIAVEASPWGFNACLRWCIPSICPLGSTVVKKLLSLSEHPMPSDLRWHALPGPKNSL